MFLVYIDGFMSSNPSWHQPNPRYQPQVPTTRGATTCLWYQQQGYRHPHGATPSFLWYQQQQHGVPPPSFLWYQQQKQQQKQGAAPQSLWVVFLHFMVPTPGIPTLTLTLTLRHI